MSYTGPSAPSVVPLRPKSRARSAQKAPLTPRPGGGRLRRPKGYCGRTWHIPIKHLNSENWLVKKLFPGTLLEFEHWFRTEEACRDYLSKLRWPQGFECARCHHGAAWRTARGLYRCTHCKTGVSLTAGTIFDHSRIPLRTWFRAAWWITNQKSGVSALGLQRLLGLGSYETAWTCLHKLRRAMVRPDREQLTGPVEIDETFVGGLSRRNSSRYTKAFVIIAAEIRGEGIGRIRLSQLPDDTEPSVREFILKTVAAGSKLVTDGAHAYKHLKPYGYGHQRHVVKYCLPGRDMAHRKLPRAHRIASLLKRWLLGVHQGRISKQQLDHYLEEFAFRFNRRFSPQRGMLFYRLLQQSVRVQPAPYRTIIHRG